MNTVRVAYNDNWGFVYIRSDGWYAIDLASGELLTISTWVEWYGAYCK